MGHPLRAGEARSRTTGRPPSGRFLARQAFYGSTAGPLALRHGEARGPDAHLGVVVGRVGAGAGPAARPGAGDAGGLGGHPRQPPGRAWCATRWRWPPASPGAARRAPPSPRWRNLARAWSPALLLGLAFRRTRKAAALALLLPALRDWADNPEALDPVRYTALHVADDAAYGAGVWAGCARARTLGAAGAAYLVALAGVVLPVAAPQARRGRPTAEPAPRCRGYPRVKRSCPRWSSQSVDSQKAHGAARPSPRRSRACRRTPQPGEPVLRLAQEPAAQARRGDTPGPPPGGRWSRASRPTRRSRIRRSPRRPRPP